MFLPHSDLGLSTVFRCISWSNSLTSLLVESSFKFKDLFIICFHDKAYQGLGRSALCDGHFWS